MRCLARLASVVVAIVLFAPAFAHAANFPVTKQADTNDGICDADCSLREAVVAANASPGPDDISVPVGHYTLTIPGSAEQAAATGDLDLATDNVTITGAGAASTVIDAGGDTGIADRVFDVVTPTITATISNVTITGGRSPSDGGGVNSDGSAILDHDVISGNKTAGGGEGGGVVANGGTPTLVTIRDSVVTGNQASNGGGYSNNGGSFSASAVAGGLIERSTFSGNTATDTGGGVGGGVIEDGGGDLRIRDTTISGNRAEGTGPSFGGGFSANGGGPGSVAISNTTISGNTASGPDSFGGGYAEDGGGIVGLTNVTIADNSIEGTGTTPQHSGGDVVEAGNGTTTFKNSIVSAGTPTNCVVTIGTIASAGNNLDSGTSCGFTGSGDQSGADPLLGPLADNGGPTQTRRLGNGSPAIDTGDNAACPAADQRGVARPQPAGGTCDKGAFERLPADVGVTMSAPPTRTRGQTITYALVVTNHGPSTAPSVTLTDALPAGLAGAAASSSAGSCAVAAQVSCNLGDLAGGATATVTITATAAQAGTVTNTAAVGHGVLVDDPNGTNDSATAQTVVQNKPALVPLRGKTVLVRVVKGTVLVAVPVRRGRVAGKRPAPGFSNFRKLKNAQLIPVRSIVDTTHGVVGMQSARTLNGSSTQSGNFSRGQFQVTQPGTSPLTTLSLFGGGNFKRGCKPARTRKHGKAIAARRRPHRSLFGNAHGRFRTRGRHSTATVRGTKWLTKDSCAGTLTVVSRGVVVVRDLVKHRNVTVRAGKRYLARPRQR